MATEGHKFDLERFPVFMNMHDNANVTRFQSFRRETPYKLHTVVFLDHCSAG